MLLKNKKRCWGADIRVLADAQSQLIRGWEQLRYFIVMPRCDNNTLALAPRKGIYIFSNDNTLLQQERSALRHWQPERSFL